VSVEAWAVIVSGAAWLAWLWLRRRHRADVADLGTVDMTNARRREIIDEEAKRWR
jgi:hypothetical protein